VGLELTTLVVIDIDGIGSFKSNSHTNMKVPRQIKVSGRYISLGGK
jgi:hypothetical protein